MHDSGHRELDLFEEARKRAPGEARDRFLLEACGDDESLRRKLQELLDADADVGSFLHEAPADIRGWLADNQTTMKDEAGVRSSELPGDRIGRYKLLQKIGEGGMGVVYMAEQEEPVRRRVAIKIIKQGMDTRQVVARFEAERQALALMDHPNIARVLDGGATETGRPFFVMELVQGVPITDYCGRAKLPTELRLQLFIQVCQAIQSAHQKGIIHRDIKPSNVLVTLHNGEPMPKIIDFGVAKATNQKLTEKTLFTQFATMIGTPAYMSPEQAEMSSMDVDTRADIYSLGVLLYALLTGTTPFPEKRLRSLGYGEMQRVIAEEEPERPSHRLSTMDVETKTMFNKGLGEDFGSLRNRLEGDLDWIVMKCLEKDRSRRYETANGLATDLKRHLDGETVVARPPSTIYRLEKAWKRNRLEFGSGAAIAAALAIGFIVSARMYFREREARLRSVMAEELAHKEQLRAEQASTALAASDRERYHQLYAAEMNLARIAWENGQIARARELLNRQLPVVGREDLRGFEWRYLWKLCQPTAKVVLEDHPDYVQSLAISPSGKHFATGDGGSKIQIWEAPGLAKVATLSRPREGGNSIRALAYSSDEKVLAAADIKTSIQLWSVPEYKEMGILEPVTSGQKAITFVPNSSDLACATEDGAVSIWDSGARQVSKRFQGTSTSRPAVAVDPTGQRLAASTGHNEIRVWNLVSRAEISRLTNHTSHVVYLQFSADGRLLASSSADGSVRLWETVNWTEFAILRGHGGARVTSATFSQDNKSLASASVDGVIQVWDVAKKDIFRTLRGHAAWVNLAAFFPDSLHLVSVSDDAKVMLWDVQSINDESHTTLTGPADSFCFSEDGRTILQSLQEGGGNLIDTRNWMPKSRLKGTLFKILEEQSDSSGLFFKNTPDGHLEICRINDGGLVSRSTNSLPSYSFFGVLSENHRLLALMDFSGHLSVWDVERGNLIRNHADLEQGYSVHTFFDTPDGQVLAREFSNRMLYWNLKTGLESEELPRGMNATVWGTNAIGTLVWISDRAGTGYLHEARTNPKANGQIHSFLRSRDKRYYFVGGDRDIAIWDVEKGKQVANLSGHSGWVRALATSSDGKRLVSAGNDGTLRLWSVDHPREVLCFPAHIPPHTTSLAFSPDGNSIAQLSNEDHIIRVFTALPMQAIEEEMQGSKKP